MNSIGYILTAAGLLLSIITALGGYQAGKRREHKGEGKNEGVLLSDIGYIKSSVDDIKREQRESLSKIESISERLTRCEESTKQAHKRIDEIK